MGLPVTRFAESTGALELTRRPATAAALTKWRSYMFDRDAPLTRRSS